MMCGSRRLQNQKLAAAWFFFYILLLIAICQGEQELVHVKAEDPYSSPTSGGGGGEEQLPIGVGSRPQCCVCERRCGGCAPCTAVQVHVGVGTECPDYEPVRWKCKCATPSSTREEKKLV